jgi:hypothetical protein
LQKACNMTTHFKLKIIPFLSQVHHKNYKQIYNLSSMQGITFFTATFSKANKANIQ